MHLFISLIRNRNLILILSVVLGLWLGDIAHHLKDYTIYILTLVMIFSMTTIRTKSLYLPSKLYIPMLKGALLNYFIYAAIMLLLAYYLIDDKELFHGFVVIATTAPGVAIIPFSSILKGDVEYAVKGVLGSFICTIVLTPFLIQFITGNDGISSMQLVYLMIKTIVIPLILSRFLLNKSIRKYTEAARGRVVDWGFALIIFIAIGVNRSVFFEQTHILWNIILVLFISHFIIGLIHEKIIGRLTKNKGILISDNLLLTIKSSGFAIVTALQLPGKNATIPTALLAVFVLLYLLFLSIRKGN